MKLAERAGQAYSPQRSGPSTSRSDADEEVFRYRGRGTVVTGRWSRGIVTGAMRSRSVGLKRTIKRLTGVEMFAQAER